MSLACGFFNSEDGDREYFNQDLSNFLEGLIEDGIYEFIDDKMMISASATPDMYVLVGKGRAWFNGTWTKIDAAYQVEIPSADPVLNRIDAICLTVNKTRAVRDNYIEIISGTGTVDAPTKPTVTDETDIYRHVLAYVTVSKGSTAITQAQIENRVGMGSALFAAPKWGDIPTTEEMVAQWQDEFAQFMDHIHETFDYDAAGMLQVGIDNLAPDIEEISETDLYALDDNVLKKKVDGNWTPTKVSAEIEDMKSAFQAGVDAVYNACIEAGITPSASTPGAIATAIVTAANGTATAADIVDGKTALSGKRLITGTRKATTTYTFPANDTGGTKDLGEQNTYRYVNAGNVYTAGKNYPRKTLADTASWGSNASSGEYWKSLTPSLGLHAGYNLVWTIAMDDVLYNHTASVGAPDVPSGGTRISAHAFSSYCHIRGRIDLIYAPNGGAIHAYCYNCLAGLAGAATLSPV